VTAQGKDHSALIDRGVELQWRERYVQALKLCERAYVLAPDCPCAVYNLANALHLTEQHGVSARLLRRLITAPFDQLLAGCDGLDALAVRGLVTDAYYLLFKAVLFGQRSWTRAVPFLDEHLRRRARGVASAWSLREIRAAVRQYESTFGARAVRRSPPSASGREVTRRNGRDGL
jgi:hypothetical protein